MDNVRIISEIIVKLKRILTEALMPTGPKGERRPADAIGNAVKVMRIATGEESETLPPEDGKDPNAKALGAKKRGPYKKSVLAMA
jgi:hypothetical protein